MANIQSIRFEDFKRFARYSVACKGTNIFVGPNNAGKSTTLDALRIFQDVHRFASRTRPTLSDQEDFGVCATYFLPHTAIGVPIDNIVRNYGDEPAKIHIRLDNDVSIHIRLHPERTAIAFIQYDGKTPRTTAEYKKLVAVDLIVVPTLSALEEHEPYVADETSNRNQNTRLASRNFRNILYRKSDEEFEKFADLCQKGWGDIELEKPKIVYENSAKMTMLFFESRMAREVYWSGFGFQIWMQMMAQFMRGSHKSILILDEPDIYLHPDLQRKVVRMAKENFSQVFISTHSTDIINEADPGDIVSISSENKKAVRVTNDEGYKRVYAYLGTSENAEFARLARAKRIVFFEGKDRSIIRKISRKIGLEGIFEDSQTVYLQAGGFAQWERVREIDWALQNIFDLKIKVGALFDSDFRCAEQISDFCQQLSNDHLWIGVLKRKEIENYALNTAVLIRTIKKRLMLRAIELTDEDIVKTLYELTSEFRDNCLSQRTANYIAFHSKINKSMDMSTHISNANMDFQKLWSDLEGRFRIISGKEFISTLSAVFQRDFQTTITLNQLIEELAPAEIDSELIEKMKALDHFFLN